MSKTKALKELIEEAPEQVSKILKALKGESDDAVAKLGSGKNLDALLEARESAPDISKVYPKNIQQDDLGKVSKEFKMVDGPQTKDFTMPHPEATVPTVRGSTLPEEIPSTIKRPDSPDMADMGDELSQFGDFGLPTAKNNKSLKNAALIGGIGAGALGLANMGGEEQPAQAMPILPMLATAAVAPVVDNLMNPKPKQELPKTPAKEAPAVPSQPVAPQAEVQPEEADYLKQLADAQDKQGELDFIDNMLRAGTTIGSAIGRTKADYTNVDALQKQNSKGVQNVKDKMAADHDSKKLKQEQTDLNDAKLLRDPQSDISKAFRSALVKLGIPHSDKTTASDAKNMGINIQNLLMQEKQLQESKNMKDLMLGDRARSQAYAATDRAVGNLYNSKDYKSYTNAKDALNSLDQAIATGDKTAIGTAFMGYAKFAQNDDSVVRSEDMKTLAGHYNYASPAEMMAKLSAKAHGGDFSSKELQAMKEVINKGIGLKGQRVKQMLAPIEGKIKGSGLNAEEHIDPTILEEFNNYAKKQEAGTGPSPAGQSAAPKETVQFKTAKNPGSIIKAGGKTFIVNPDGMTGTEQ